MTEALDVVVMLSLKDRLWKKLDDAHRDRDIPALLSSLAEMWSDEAANSLFWDCLCHQETCYGATYAAIPHLLKIAQPETNRHQRLEIALFLGFVARCARDTREGLGGNSEDRPLQGLPQTLDAWDRKLDCYRDLLVSFEDPNRMSSRYEQVELVPRYRKILAIEPIHAGDLEKIQSIKRDFFAALPSIRMVCERALLENLQDKNVVRHLLAGIATADGLLDLACLLNFGTEGQFRCSSCDRSHEYILFGDRVALYTDDERALDDFKARAPSTADGFVVPADESEVSDRRTAALLSLAERAASTEPAVLLRNLLGHFVCGKCGQEQPIRAV